MKYIKMLGLLAVSAAALMAFAGTASATTITSSTGETPTNLHAVSVGHATLHNAVGSISCNSTVTGSVTSHGAGVTVKGHISTLSFTNCTNGTVHTNAQGHVASPGTLEVHADPNGKTRDGILTSSGARVTITMFGVECGYETNNTPIGTVDGGTDAKLTISASIPRSHGSFFCGSAGNWTGEYTVNHPHVLEIH